jgi:hypothetical protein
MGTLGDLVRPINVAKFGIIACDSSPTIMKYSCDPAFVEMGGYFAAARSRDELPWVEFNFRGGLFRLAGVTLEKPPVEGGKPKKLAPGALEVAVLGEGIETWLCEGGQGKMEVAHASLGRAVRLTMVGENETGGWIFLFGTLRLWGSFIA